MLSIVLGMLVAFMLNSRHVRMRPTWLALFLIPFVVTPVVAGIAWRFFMWQQEFGVINEILSAHWASIPITGFLNAKRCFLQRSSAIRGT